MSPEIIAVNVGRSHLRKSLGPENEVVVPDSPIREALVSVAGGPLKKLLGNLALIGILVTPQISAPANVASGTKNFTTNGGIALTEAQQVQCQTVSEAIINLCNKRPEEPVSTVACEGGYTTVQVSRKVDAYGRTGGLEWIATDALTGQTTEGQCTNPDGSPIIVATDTIGPTVGSPVTTEIFPDVRSENSQSNAEDTDWLAIARNTAIIIGLIGVLRFLIPRLPRGRRK